MTNIGNSIHPWIPKFTRVGTSFLLIWTQFRGVSKWGSIINNFNSQDDNYDVADQVSLGATGWLITAKGF